VFSAEVHVCAAHVTVYVHGRVEQFGGFFDTAP
jgi:hypothetical protein